jgi:hypothetical protein
MFPLPALKLLLKPSLECDTADHCIDVQMILDIPTIAKDAVLFHHVLARGPIKTMQYSEHAIKVRDSFGTVPVYSQDSNDRRQRKFFAGRDISPGQMSVEYQAERLGTPQKPVHVVTRFHLNGMEEDLLLLGCILSFDLLWMKSRI